MNRRAAEAGLDSRSCPLGMALNSNIVSGLDARQISGRQGAGDDSSGLRGQDVRHAGAHHSDRRQRQPRDR